MPAPTTLVLPAGAHLKVTKAGLVVRHDGDVVLEQTLGHVLARAEAGNNLELRLPEATGDLRAGGRLTITQGTVRAGTIEAREIHLGDQAITARAITASQRIVIGAAQLVVDIIIAPEIRIDGRARGRVTVIESHNDREPNRIKGGFSLAEYDELFGDCTGFLAERGVKALKPDDAPEEVPMPPASTDEDEELIEVEFEVEEDDIAPSVPGPAGPSPDDGAEEPVILTDAELSPIEEEDDDLQAKLVEVTSKIRSCYAGREVPPAVARLQALIDARDHAGLRRSITDMWNELLSFHQRKGIRPHHRVTHAFNVIHALVQG